MTGSGIVDDVFGGSVPDTAEAARMVLVNRTGGGQVQFAIPLDGPEPARGEHIEWGPHYAWWGEHRVHKLTWELDPAAARWL